MHDETIRGEFTHQAETFNDSAVAHDPATLDGLIAVAAPSASERWLDLCCGPGIVTRALAAHADSVLGVDATPAMVAAAQRASAQTANASFEVGDATALELPDATFDGAVNRFALHHIPVPGRVLDTLARVVKPGGTIVVADHLLDADGAGAAWSQEIERLRDPSHWSSLTAARLRALGAAAGLILEHEQSGPIELDFDDWLARGSGGTVNAAAIERALIERPQQSDCFQVSERGGARILTLQIWIGRFRAAAGHPHVH
jgi:SAM-dependent methyltransferase